MGRKAAGAGERREDASLSFNLSFTTNSSIKIIKFHFFQSFWEKERFILAGIPVGTRSCAVNSPSRVSIATWDVGWWSFPVMDVYVLRVTVNQQ